MKEEESGGVNEAGKSSDEDSGVAVKSPEEGEARAEEEAARVSSAGYAPSSSGTQRSCHTPWPSALLIAGGGSVERGSRAPRPPSPPLFKTGVHVHSPPPPSIPLLRHWH